MLISDKLILVELQKAGARKLKPLLVELLGGLDDNKATGPTAEQLAAGAKVAATVCDPWTWYLALWLNGCAKKGTMYRRLTDAEKWTTLREKMAAASAAKTAADAAKPAVEIPEEAGTAEGEAAAKREPLPENFSAAHAAEFWYSSPDNAAGFREWLRAILTQPQVRRLADAAFAKSPLGRTGGLLTHLYFDLCTRDGKSLTKEDATPEALRALDGKSGLVDYFILAESRPADLVATLEGVGVALDPDTKKRVRQIGRNDVAKLPHELSYYYDAETAQLVLRREKFMVEKFGYKSSKPKVTEASAQ